MSAPHTVGPSGRAEAAALMGTMRGSGEGRAALVYDGACPLCSATVAWIGRSSREGAFEMVPCPSEMPDSRFPEITRDACMRAMQLVLPDGTVLAGERALPEVLARLRRYGRLRAFFRIPGVPALSRVLYRWFADHRYGIAKLLRRSLHTGQTKDRPWQRKMS